MIHLIIGGIKSGKTKYALKKTNEISIMKNSQKIYLATATAFDDEMQAKINAHKSERDSSWATIESNNIAEVLNNAKSDQVIMIDCISMWLSNLILNEADINKNTEQLINALQSAVCDVVIVSNEVGHSLVSDNKLGRQFQNEQGLINQKLAEVARNVDFIIAGLSTNLKG